MLDRRVGEFGEGGAQAFVDRVDLADDVDGEAAGAAQGEDHVGQPAAAGGAQIDGAFERFVEQRA